MESPSERSTDTLIEAKGGAQAPKESVEIAAIAAMVSGVFAPFAENQKYVAQEVTKQTQIIVNAKTKIFWGAFLLALVVLALCFYAMHLGKDQFAEKVVIAIVGFLGGLGVGKQLSGKGG